MAVHPFYFYQQSVYFSYLYGEDLYYQLKTSLENHEICNAFF